MLNEATRANLKRKSAYIDKVQLYEGRPLFSWIDLSLTELCNRSHGHARACSFCPRYDPAFYPNQNLNMPVPVVSKIAHELQALKYTGSIVLCGYGEPLLHPNIKFIVEILKNQVGCRVELVTNGDFLGPERAKELRAVGLDYFVVSMYDGVHQIEKFKQTFFEAGVTDDFYLLRDRWHNEADKFGLKLTNRAGTVTVGLQDPVPDTKQAPCFYPAYQLQVDYNGDVLLCPQDWYKRVRFGNVMTESLVNIWFGGRLNKRRRQLMAGRREDHPCSQCNTDGTLHGENHVAAWTKEKTRA